MSGARRVEPSMADILAEIRQMVGPDGPGVKAAVTPVATPTGARPAASDGMDDLADLLEPQPKARVAAPEVAPVAPRTAIAPIDRPLDAPAAPMARPGPAVTLETPLPNVAVPLRAEPIMPPQPRTQALSLATEAAGHLELPPAVPSAIVDSAPRQNPRASLLGRPLGDAVPAPAAQPDPRGPASVGSIDALIGALRPGSLAGPKVALPTLPEPARSTVPATDGLDASVHEALGALAIGLASRGLGAPRIEPTLAAPTLVLTPKHPSAPDPEPVHEPVPEPVVAETTPPLPAPLTLAPETLAAKADVIEPLATAAAASASPEPTPVAQVAVPEGLDDRMVELLRPMLRHWLDANLPRIVEKALRVELAAGVPVPRSITDVRPTRNGSGHA